MTFLRVLSAALLVSLPASVARADEPDQTPLKAAIYLLQFALKIGPNGAPPIRIIDAGIAVQNGHEQASMSELSEYVKLDDGPCTFEKRSFVPVTADAHFASLDTLDHYVVWHTRIDFSKMSSEYATRGEFLYLNGEIGAFCKYETRFAPGITLDVARQSVSRTVPPAGTVIKCGRNLEGVATADSFRFRLLKSLSYIHTHLCPAHEMPL